jgi:uncharacterized membrane protein YkvA (DUF1232 family)
MKFVEKGKDGIRKLLTECLALLFVLTDRRVPWYARIVVLVPLGYIASPIDLIPDGLLFFGQIDDLIVVRYSYILLKKLVAPVVLEDCRDRAKILLSQKGKNRMKFAISLSAIWILLLTFLAIYLIKKISRHSISVIK